MMNFGNYDNETLGVPDESYTLANFDNVPEREQDDFFDVLSERNGVVKQTIDSQDFRSPNSSQA